MSVTIRRLARGDDRVAFESGDIELDRFFRLYAGQNQFRHRIGVTYVAVDEAGVIVGFATAAASEIGRDESHESGRVQLKALPVLRLARLAVDRRRQGQGIGGLLLRTIFALAHRMAEDIGCTEVVVDAKPGARAYYERLGFQPLPITAGELGDRPKAIPMVIPLHRIPRSATVSAPGQIG